MEDPAPRTRRTAAEWRIRLCVMSADTRPSFDGLAALTHNQLAGDLADGSCS